MKPLHLIASKNEFRPALHYIQLLDGYFNVTDCHTLLKVPQFEILPDSIINEIPKECYFLASDWKNSKIDKSSYFKINNNLIECMDNKFKTLGFLPFLDVNEFIQKVGKFPDINCVIPKDEFAEQMVNFSLNPELLNNIYNANGKDPIQLTFFGKNRAAKIKFKESDSIGLIMPMIFEK